MKRNIILVSVIIIVGIIALFSILYIRSLHKVSIAFDSEVKGVTIYNQADKEVKRISAPGEVSLQNNSYYIIPTGDKLSQSRISFTVKDQDIQLTIDPEYSAEVLDAAMANNKADIESVAITTFPLIGSQYTLQNETLMHHGEWFGALVAKKVDDPREQPDYYRILLHKKDNTWKVINSPVLVLTKTEFKDVPAKIIDAVNNLNP